MADDTILPAAHQTDVPIRITHGSWMDETFVGVAKNTKVPSLRYVFSARTVLPPKFTVMIPIINLDDRSQTQVRGTKLGVLEKVEEVGDAKGGDALSSSEPEPVVDRTKALKKAEVIGQIIQALQKELNDEQQRKVHELLKNNEVIFCTGEHDIGRTHLTEHRIDTGDHRPIRQPLRR